MKSTWRRLLGPGAALGLLILAGCQTYVMETGQTLPSGWYLQHRPQYIPPSPQYPLSRELANLTAASAQPGVPAPPPLVPGPPPPPPGP